jgi:hypothetical protein
LTCLCIRICSLNNEQILIHGLWTFILQPYIDGGLGALGEYFGELPCGDLHDAMTDADLTLRVYKNMVEVGTKMEAVC